jgi:SAM-dependent methyltransferase
MKRYQEMFEYYRDRAAHYDKSTGYGNDSQKDMQFIESIKDWLMDLNVLEVACGPGYWTSLLYPYCKTILATDYNEAVLREAKSKSLPKDKVTFVQSNAFSFDNIQQKFSGGLAIQFLSHVPKDQRRLFLEKFHNKLDCGAAVVFADSYFKGNPKSKGLFTNEHGDLVHYRTLPNGRKYLVVKNLPTESELRNVIQDYGENISYEESTTHHLWILKYKKK